MVKKQKYIYEAKVLSIHDGDTISVEIDLGFQMRFTDKIRFYGINAPELKIRDEQKKLITNPEGLQTLLILKELIKVGDMIILETIKDNKEKFGRYLANVYVNKESDKQIFVNQYLVDHSLAIPMKY